MKNISYKISVLLLMFAGLANRKCMAQVPGGTRATATAVPVPGGYTTQNVNYIRQWEPEVPLTDTAAVASPARSVREVKQTTQYFDGLGRSLQTVAKGISGNGKDVVTPLIYDDYGREQYMYLPYVPQNASDGKLKLDPFNGQSVYYKTDTLNFGTTGENIFYSKFEYEPSPLNRQLKAYAPGNSWVSKPKEKRYQVNAVNDSVRIWNITAGLPLSSGFYAVGQLLKEVSVDEQQNQIIEYRNKQNQLILKKVQITDAPSVGHAGWLCTYYVYDDMGNLRSVMSPKAVDAVKSNWTITTAIDTGLCFQYQYDVRRRMIIKRTPGSGPVFMVYDNRDRPVFTQDSVQRAKSPMEWLVTYYDGRDRPTMTAIYQNSITRDSLQKIMNTVSGTPNLPETALTPLTYIYYDNYDYPGKKTFYAADTMKVTAPSDQYPERLSIGNMTLGLITGNSVRVLGTNKWLTTTFYYNDKGRTVQVCSDNNMGGVYYTTILYNFKGAVLSTYVRHRNPRSAIAETTVLTINNYDHGGRLLTVKKCLNDNTALERTIVSNKYDELGRVKIERIGGTSTSFIDSLAYTYNIRGWLQGINKDFVNGLTGSSNWFGQELSYDYGFTSNQYNGNISGMKWKGRSDSAWAYGYSYDLANRVTAANFTQKNGNSWAQDKKDFSVSNLTYDANGNIMSMWQKGMVGTKSQIIDSLNYTYPANSNRLLAVSDIDSSRTKSARLGDFIDGNKGSKDYTYDANGNLIADLNKQIRSIKYNQLNLPEEVSIIGKGKIVYQYDAQGNKLSKTVIDSTGTTPKTIITDYNSEFVYRNDSIEFIIHEEGRIRTIFKTGDSVRYAYDYFEKDHLGNIRTVLTDQTDLSMYVATMETEAAATETALFSNVDETRAEKPVGYPEDQTTSENKSVAKLNGKTGGKKIGPSLVLKVMAGDTVQIMGKAFYKSQGPESTDAKVPAEEMLAGLLMAFGGSEATAGEHNEEIITNNTPFNENFYNNDYQRLKEKNSSEASTVRPKAYLNFVLFDEDFKMVESNSGVRQVKQDPDQLQQLDVDKMPIEKSGFLYVYTSNESTQDVYFDNVILALSSGPLLEETHYYPYGLTMAGISSNALKGTKYSKNRKEFNGMEHTTDLGLEQYDAFYRTLDPQLGRWWQIDPKPQETFSPYAAMAGNPILYSDPLGDTTWVYGTAGQFLGVVYDKLANQIHFMANDNPNTPAFDARNLSAKDARKLGEAIRNGSMAFIGKNTVAKLKEITAKADKTEIAFVGSIGEDKEIILKDMPVDEYNHRETVNIIAQVEKNYSHDKQAGFFLFGHVHGKSLLGPISYGDGSDWTMHKWLGEPTVDYDYQPVLYRNASTKKPGATPALLATPYGVTVYGTGTTSQMISGIIVVDDNKIAPLGSYFLYKRLTK